VLERTSSSEVRIYLLSLVSLMKSGFDFSSCPDGSSLSLSLVSLMKSDFGFSCPNGSNIVYGGNVFGHVTSKNDFLVLDLDNYYNDSPSVWS